jgi:hypothetical protein
MYAPNVNEMTRDEVRIAALQQQRILNWRVLERERRDRPRGRTRDQREGRRHRRPTATWLDEPC